MYRTENSKFWGKKFLVFSLSLCSLISMAEFTSSHTLAAPITWTNGNGTGLASDPLNWSGSSVPGATDDVILDATSTANIIWDGQTGAMPQMVNSWTQTAAYTGEVNFQTTYTGTNSNGFNVFSVVNDVTIGGGTWTHEANGLAHANDPVGNSVHRLRVDVGGNFTLASGTSIDVDSQGFFKANPGANGGASHGGQSSGNRPTYGSAFMPELHGMGALTAGGSNPQDGGGSVYLTVGGLSTLDGNILANVLPGGSFTRGAAGGSILIETGDLTGTGIIQARGQDSSGGSNTGNGGGGRVAVILNDGGADFSNFNPDNIDARAGLGGNFSNKGAAGSVYLQTGDQSSGAGELVVDFVNVHGDLIDDYAHELTSEDFSSTSVRLQRLGHLQISATNTIGSLAGDGTSNLTIDSGQTLTTGGNNSDTTMSGMIRGDGSLIKTGNGTMTLDATNSYTGGTTVAAGTLLVNNTAGSGTGTGDVTVESGATLGGTGILDGLATFEAGATLAPGTSPGTLTFNGGLTLEDGSILEMEVGSSNDFISITGGTITGSTSSEGIGLMLSSDIPYFSTTLLDWSGATAVDLDLADFYFLPGSITGDLAFVGNSLQFTVPIPEPSSACLLSLGVGLAMMRRRKRARIYQS